MLSSEFGFRKEVKKFFCSGRKSIILFSTFHFFSLFFYLCVFVVVFLIYLCFFKILVYPHELFLVVDSLMRTNWLFFFFGLANFCSCSSGGKRRQQQKREMWGLEMWLSHASLTLSAWALAALLWRQETARYPGSNLKAGAQGKKIVENYPECQIRF